MFLSLYNREVYFLKGKQEIKMKWIIRAFLIGILTILIELLK